MRTLNEIERAAVVAKVNKWQVTLDPQDVLLMVLYIRQAEVALTEKHVDLVKADLRATARDLGLRQKITATCKFPRAMHDEGACDCGKSK